MGLRYRQLENPQPTTQWPCPLTVDSTTIEKDKEKPPASKPTNPTTTATSRPSSGNQGTRTTERRTSKSMMQCLQSTLKVRDQEPRRPEQRTTRSPRSVARRFMQSGTAKDRGGCSPSPLARSHSSLDAGVRSPSMIPNVHSDDPMLQLDDLLSGLPIEEISRNANGHRTVRDATASGSRTATS